MSIAEDANKWTNFPIVKADNGRIAFPKSQFKGLATKEPSALLPDYEVIIHTEAWDDGRIFRLSSKERMEEVAKEITDQL